MKLAELDVTHFHQLVYVNYKYFHSKNLKNVHRYRHFRHFNIYRHYLNWSVLNKSNISCFSRVGTRITIDVLSSSTFTRSLSLTATTFPQSSETFFYRDWCKIKNINYKELKKMSKNKLNLTLPPGVADNQQPVSPSAPLSAASDAGYVIDRTIIIV